MGFCEPTLAVLRATANLTGLQWTASGILLSEYSYDIC